MSVVESRRTRHLIVQLGRGEELPGALIRALDGAEARAGWVTGSGTLEAAEIVLVDARRTGYAPARRVDTPCDVVSLSGSLARHEGAGHLRLSANLARERDVGGVEVLAGHLVWARVYSLELHVVVFDDVGLVRALDERTGLAALTPAPAAVAAAPRPAGPPATPPAARVAPEASSMSSHGGATFASEREAAGPPIPIRPYRAPNDVEHYPEAGDLVNHFHFGDCTVIDSDGERIRLRQERDGRVREVALTMLRIDVPTLDETTGKRSFRLTRKN
jgi:predicted DNA-binding protein with PD1-like motif